MNERERFEKWFQSEYKSIWALAEDGDFYSQDCRDYAYFGYKAALASQEPVGYVNKNPSGQISLRDMNDNAFDMSKYIGDKIYTSPQAHPDLQDARLKQLESILIAIYEHGTHEGIFQSISELIPKLKNI
jgi:hypothetical protein